MSKKETHNAIVTRNTDDDLGTQLRGSIFFDAPTLFEGEFPIPAEPCFPYASNNGSGMFFVPQVGDEIEIEIEADDQSGDTTDIELPEPRWRCMIYSDAADIDDKFKENYPFRMGWKSRSGHFLLFDDSEGNEFISLLSSEGHEFIMSDASGAEKIQIKSVTGHTLLIDEVTNEISILHKSGAIIKLSDTKIEIIDKTGSQSVVLEAGKVTAKAAAEFVANSPIVKLGLSPTFHATLSENVIGLHDQHLHNAPQAQTGILPTTTPTVPMSSKAGTPLDPTAINIVIKGNL